MANNETILERENAMVTRAEADVELLHLVVHGDSELLVPTKGGMVPSLAKQAVLAQEKVTASLNEVALGMAGSMSYTSTELGILGTNHGGLFSVPSPSNKEYLILYENVGGVPVDTGKRSPSAEYVFALIDSQSSLLNNQVKFSADLIRTQTIFIQNIAFA